MKSLIFVLVAFTVACSGSPTAPSRGPGTGGTVAGGCLVAGECDGPGGDPETIHGGKACVLTPASPNDVPICHYTCPNGVMFSEPNPGTGCPEVAPQPKKEKVQ